MSFAPEPAFSHGTAAKTAVLICNLGTPDEPTPKAVRRYLAEFLSDPRVVEIPRLLWWPILHAIVLRVRPAKSARKYARVWMKEGSPLKVWTEKQALLLAGYLGQRGQPVLVRHAMRYGQPSIAAATTAGVGDALAAWMKRRRNLPELRFVKHWHDDPGYIGALARRVSDHWMMHGRPDRLVLSFHGLPKRSLTLGDPYHCECLKTSRLLTERLKLREENVVVTFQSRFGKAEWLQPYTEPTLIALAKEGVARVDVFCPGFVADCLETLEEIDLEARAAFLAAGGKEFGYIPCLNDQHEGIAALAGIAIRHMQGWEQTPADGDGPASLEQQRMRAVAAGARS